MRVITPQQKYLNEVFGLSDPALTGTRAAMDKGEVEFMSVSGAEARILQFLIRGFGIRTIVEFGTLYGYSALAMASVLPADGKLISLEKDPRNQAPVEKTLSSSPAGKKVELKLGDVLESMRAIETQGPFDMVFIDADKAGYVKYLNWAEKNVRKGGLIVGDNTFLWGGLWGESTDGAVNPNTVAVMREFNARLADPLKYNSILVPTVEGLTVAQKLQ